MEATYGRVQESIGEFYEEFLNYSAMKDGEIIDIQGDEEQGFTMIYGSEGDRRARNYDNSTELIQDFNENLRKYSDSAEAIGVFGGLLDEEGSPEERIMDAVSNSDGYAARKNDEWAVDAWNVFKTSADQAYLESMAENGVYITPAGVSMALELEGTMTPAEAVEQTAGSIEAGFEDAMIDHLSAATVDAVSEAENGENYNFLVDLEKRMG